MQSAEKIEVEEPLPRPRPKQKKTVRFVEQQADGVCIWDFTWFPPGLRLLRTESLAAMQILAEITGYELADVPSASAEIVHLESERGCPKEAL